MRLQAAWLLLPLAVVALLAAGCGDTLALDPVAKAADVTVKQTSEHMTMSATVSIGGQTIVDTGYGDFQNDPNRGTLTVVAKGAGRTVSIDAVLADTSVYMTSAAFAGQLPAGKSWLKLDYEKAFSAAGISTSSLAASSPADALQELQASGKVTDDGPATIDGVATTHYTAILDPSRAAKIQKVTKITVEYGPVEVWVDQEGRVRRMQMTSIASGPGTPQETASMTMTLSRYGEPVAATAPPDSEVYDMTGLATSLLKKK
jgi:LppX_LprAFG lipoprotein